MGGRIGGIERSAQYRSLIRLISGIEERDQTPTMRQRSGSLDPSTHSLDGGRTCFAAWAQNVYNAPPCHETWLLIKTSSLTIDDHHFMDVISALESCTLVPGMLQAMRCST